MLSLILGYFCTFIPQQPEKWKFKKNQKTPENIIILHICTKNHMLYCSWDMVHDWCNYYFSFFILSYYLPFYLPPPPPPPHPVTFFILGYFLPFYPPNSPKENLKKKSKNAWRYHHFTHLEISFYTSVPKIMIMCLLFLRYGTWPM